MRSIEVFVVFSVAALNLTVVPGRVRFNQFVPDSEFCQRCLKECGLGAVFGIQPVCKLRAVVCLNTLNGIGELLNTVLDKFIRGIGAMLLEGLQIAE